VILPKLTGAPPRMTTKDQSIGQIMRMLLAWMLFFSLPAVCRLMDSLPHLELSIPDFKDGVTLFKMSSDLN